jgi:nitroimidazol reductase NimA-like FMN-containing flavoprotein (pyridoxamine 5'-phosphate oxidase superfamily)
MSEKEIRNFISEWTWGTLIGVQGNKPYAIEVSYGSDREYIYCGSKPGGRMARIIKQNPNVVFKICDAERGLGRWRAVTVEGKAERLTSYEEILYAVRLIAKRLGLPETRFDPIAVKVAKNPENANSLRIPLKKLTGRASP